MKNGVVLWVAGFAGVLLIYAAYKNKTPLGVLNSYSGIEGDSGIAGSVANGIAAGAVTPSTALPEYSAPGTGGARYFSDQQPLVGADTTYDANGNSVDVPPAYQGSLGTFIPGTVPV